MDLRLPLLAEINLHVSVAEEAVSEQDFQSARFEVEKAELAFEDLRAMWPDLNDSERGLLTAMAKPLSERLQTAKAGIPALKVVSAGEKEEVSEEERRAEAEFEENLP